MMVEERHRAILDRLRLVRSLSVEEASELCRVSPDTIRRDFRRLAEQKAVRRTHGGILLAEEFAFDSAIPDREVLHQAEKRRIGEYAATLVADGETIAIDAGTTAIEAIPFLGSKQNLTVLTYSLDVARAAVDSGALYCIMLGGLVRQNTYSAVGPDATAMLKRFQANTLFLAANAVSMDRGLMTPNRMEAEVKRGLIEISQRVVLLADSSKIGRRALVSFADTAEIDMLVTDSGAEQEQLRVLEELGIEVVVV
jgi:DeoR/GlpR family transcriptional regulator of sugar metabolism